MLQTVEMHAWHRLLCMCGYATRTARAVRLNILSPRTESESNQSTPCCRWSGPFRSHCKAKHAKKPDQNTCWRLRGGIPINTFLSGKILLQKRNGFCRNVRFDHLQGLAMRDDDLMLLGRAEVSVGRACNSC